MADAVPHTLFQWSLSCSQFILLFLSFMSTLLSYYTLVFCFTLLSSPCVGTIQFLHKRAYIHCPYSVSGLSWYQRQSLAPFLLSPGAPVHGPVSYSVNRARDIRNDYLPSNLRGCLREAKSPLSPANDSSY